MKQNKVSKPRASKKGSEAHHEAVDEPVLEQYTVIIHDPEILKMRAEKIQMLLEEPVVEISVEPEVEMLLEAPVPEQEPIVLGETVDEYVAKYSEDGQKVYNPSSKRYVKCDSALAKRLNLIR
jgi:hypothetical protein